VGAYPIEAVKMMVRIALETESSYHTKLWPQRRPLTQQQAVSHAARTLAEGTNVQAIVVFTQSGNSAHLISKDRPPTPIYAYTPSERIYRQLALWWGVWPSCIEVQVTTEDLIACVEQRLQKDKLVQRGAYVVLMGSMPIASQGRTNFVKLHYVGENT
jgi:pyruvate kinase